VPEGSKRVGGTGIRLGRGTAAVRAEVKGKVSTTTVTLDGIAGLENVRVGATLAADDEVKSVTLDGERVRKPTTRETNRGVEVTVKAPASGRHTVVVTAR
jgi:hypothetical protein